MKPLVLVFAFISLISNSQTLTPVYPSSGFSGNAFGKRIALDDNNHLFATTQNTPYNAQKGAIYRFDYASGNAVQTNFYEIPTLTAEDDFAYSIDVNQNFVASGTPGQNSSIGIDTGCVYIFENSNAGALVQTITAPIPAAEDKFGINVYFKDNFLFVSQISSTVGNTGSVYVYQYNGSSYQFVQQITSQGIPYFGSKVWGHNNHIYIGEGNVFNDTSAYQSVKAYEWNGTEWTSNSSYDLHSPFKAIDFHNDDLIVLTNNLNINTLTTFNDDGTSWVNAGSFTINFDDFFTRTIKIKGDIMAVGANYYILQTERKFPVKIYQYTNSSWTQTHTLYGYGTEFQDDAFGSVLDMNASGISIGAWRENHVLPFNGKAYYIPFSNLDTPTFTHSSFVITPNPAHEFIQLNSDALIEKVQVFDLSGKQLSVSFENGVVPIAHIENGMYILQATDENGVIFTTKFLKK